MYFFLTSCLDSKGCMWIKWCLWTSVRSCYYLVLVWPAVSLKVIRVGKQPACTLSLWYFCVYVSFSLQFVFYICSINDCIDLGCKYSLPGAILPNLLSILSDELCFERRKCVVESHIGVFITLVHVISCVSFLDYPFYDHYILLTTMYLFWFNCEMLFPGSCF